MAPTGSIDEICVNTIRTLCIDAVQQAKSGHPGTPMAMAPVVYTQISEQSNWPLGGALAFVLMLATLTLTVGAHALVQRRHRRRGIA